MTSLAFLDAQGSVLETVTRVTRFGIAFRDAVGGAPVDEGLEVRLSRLDGGRATGGREAFPNGAGFFVATDLPGMREFESGDGDEEFWTQARPTRRFLVEVRDALGRFVSVALRVELPPGASGPVVPECIAELAGSDAIGPASPARPVPFVPLFSAPERIVPAGMASVRATLIDATTDGPAAYAVLEVTHSGALLARGIADARGAVLVAFAWPEPSSPASPASPPGSPPDSPPGASLQMRPLTEQRWTLDIAVRYGRQVARHRSDPARERLPDLCELVRQPSAVVETAGSPPEPLVEQELRYGEELIIGTPDSRTLLITPA